MESREISLKGGEYYITPNNKDSFRVVEGNVLVYIVPFQNDTIGRRSFIYEAQPQEVIPGFHYKDAEYQSWRFCFVALDKAKLVVIDNGSTKILRERFSIKAKIKNYKMEGYEEGLVDQYRTNIVTEDGFIRRSQAERQETSQNILQLIYNAFQKKDIGLEMEKTKNGLYNSVAIICNKYRIPIASFEKMKEACGDEFDVSDIARLSHFSYREVILSNDWYKKDSGAFLVLDSKGKPFVCLPTGKNGYVLYDESTGKSCVVTKQVAENISVKAFMFYRPLSTGKVCKRDMINFCLHSIQIKDMLMLTLLTLFTSLIGILIPVFSQKIYDEYIPIGAKGILFQFGCMMASFMIANVMFTVVQNLFIFRITSKMAYDFQGAIYNRLFNLPESFFRKYESADLGQRVMGAGNTVNGYASSIFSLIVAFVFVVIYFFRMALYSWKLTGIGILMVGIYLFGFYLIIIKSIKYQEEIAELNGKTSSLMFQFLMGISKIRIAGVEDRALYEYMKPYIKLRDSEARKNNITDIGMVINTVVNSIFSIVLYIVIINGNLDVSVGSFIAFNSIFGMFTANSLQLIQAFITMKNLKPIMTRLTPIFNENPEFDDAKELPGEISGGIEINNVTFAYSSDGPNILENISLNIKHGEYVGIVGSSGCGKSTLLKLLLGFESPVSGKIYYDNKDIDNIDKRELRKKIGVVLQDGKLISGSIFENITITSPRSKVEDVQKVIKSVGLENDIKEMPMGLHTVLSEDCGTISGGQQQRILIARAIISNPKILFFDEATSALDNVTQNMVCETLEQMNSTRIVIAHRLSTIMNCDRIIVLDSGKVVEQGSYQELMEYKGLFYQLASRQMS